MMRKKPKTADKQTEDLAKKVIDAAREVHYELGGPGLLASIYESALCIELAERKIPFERQKEIPVIYKGQAIGSSLIDLMVNDCILFELKSIKEVQFIHKAQLLTSLKISQKQLGYLINFNTHIFNSGIHRFVI